MKVKSFRNQREGPHRKKMWTFSYCHSAFSAESISQMTINYLYKVKNHINIILLMDSCLVPPLKLRRHAVAGITIKKEVYKNVNNALRYLTINFFIFQCIMQ